MTVSGLIDYLQQFPGTHEVILSDEEDAPEGDYVALDCIPGLSEDAEYAS